MNFYPINGRVREFDSNDNIQPLYTYQSLNLLKYCKIEIQYYNYNKAALLYTEQQTMYNSNKSIVKDLIGSTVLLICTKKAQNKQQRMKIVKIFNVFLYSVSLDWVTFDSARQYGYRPLKPLLIRVCCCSACVDGLLCGQGGVFIKTFCARGVTG